MEEPFEEVYVSYLLYQDGKAEKQVSFYLAGKDGSAYETCFMYRSIFSLYIFIPLFFEFFKSQTLYGIPVPHFIPPVFGTLPLSQF